METLSITWPAAVAVIASIITLTYGAMKIMAQGKNIMSVASLHKEHRHLGERVQAVELQMRSLESDLSGTITTQVDDLKEDIRRLDAKIDGLVREVVKSLTSKAKE